MNLNEANAIIAEYMGEVPISHNLDGKCIKILNRKHSRLVQNILFDLGYQWKGFGSTLISSTVLMSMYLSVGIDDNYISISPSTNNRTLFSLGYLKKYKEGLCV